MRLIDANEAKRRIIAFATGCHSEVLSVDTIIMLLNQAPTVDAVVLPCKLGDDVYMIPSKEAFDWSMRSGHEENIRVYHQYIVCITFTERGWHLVANADKEYGTGKVLVDSSYRETWFLSREEAEAALAKMKGGASNG